MRKIVGLLAGLILCWTMVQATPSKAKWVRKIFIGFDNDSYYCLSIEWDQPGSYYEYTDYVYFCKHNNDGTLVERTLLRKIYNKRELNEDLSEEWIVEEKIKSPINLERYLIENNIYYMFPSDCLNKFKISFSKKGMFLEYGDRKELLLSKRDLEKWIQDYKYLIDEIRVVEYYKSEQYFYFIIQYGSRVYDANFIQDIIVVNSSKVEEVVESLEKETKLYEWKKVNRKRPVFIGEKKINEIDFNTLLLTGIERAWGWNVQQIKYADLDNDGKDEIILNVYEDEKYGARLTQVFKLLDTKELIELEIDRSFSYSLSNGYAGHTISAIYENRLIECFPITGENESINGPNRKIRCILFKWDGDKFSVDKAADWEISDNEMSREKGTGFSGIIKKSLKYFELLPDK